VVAHAGNDLVAEQFGRRVGNPVDQLARAQEQRKEQKAFLHNLQR
jgi:hypothetical protein